MAKCGNALFYLTGRTNSKTIIRNPQGSWKLEERRNRKREERRKGRKEGGVRSLEGEEGVVGDSSSFPTGIPVDGALDLSTLYDDSLQRPR